MYVCCVFVCVFRVRFLFKGGESVEWGDTMSGGLETLEMELWEIGIHVLYV